MQGFAISLCPIMHKISSTQYLRRINPEFCKAFEQGVMTWQIVHGLWPKSLRHKFVKRSMVSEYKTRNHRAWKIPRVMLWYAKRSFYFSGVRNWSDIPGNIREQESLACFKERFRKYLQDPQHQNTTPW